MKNTSLCDQLLKLIESTDDSEDDSTDCEKNGHKWGPVQTARLTGNPHKKCRNCKMVSLDLEDEEVEEADRRYDLL